MGLDEIIEMGRVIRKTLFVQQRLNKHLITGSE